MKKLTENRIRDLREDSDLTQQQVADAIGITQRKYSYIETGQQQLTDDILIKLANFYNVSIDYLLRQTANPSEISDVKFPKSRLLGLTIIQKKGNFIGKNADKNAAFCFRMQKRKSTLRLFANALTKILKQRSGENGRWQ